MTHMNIMKLAQLMLLVATASLTMASACSKDDEDEPSGQSSTVDNSNGDWVDLGLPSGLLWARCNVGATKPEEYGDYFAWGETSPKSEYSAENYVYYGYGEYSGRNYWAYEYEWYCHKNITKYCTDAEYGHNGFTDGLTILQSLDDAATAIIGGGARTPTANEWQELMDNCTIKHSKKNGVNGILYTGRNGNNLFLPAAGYYTGETRLCYDICFFYWSSSLDTVSPYQAFFCEGDRLDLDCLYREQGFSVRPVRSAR